MLVVRNSKRIFVAVFDYNLIVFLNSSSANKLILNNVSLLIQARMIAGVKEGQVTEMHDISWESIDSSSVCLSLVCAVLSLIFDGVASCPSVSIVTVPYLANTSASFSRMEIMFS